MSFAGNVGISDLSIAGNNSLTIGTLNVLYNSSYTDILTVISTETSSSLTVGNLTDGTATSLALSGESGDSTAYLAFGSDITTDQRLIMDATSSTLRVPSGGTMAAQIDTSDRLTISTANVTFNADTSVIFSISETAVFSVFANTAICSSDKLTCNSDLQVNQDFLVQGGFYMSGANATPSLYYGNLFSTDTRMTLTSTTCDWYVPQGGTFNVYETSNATALCYVNSTQSGFSTDVDITGTLTVGSLTDHYTSAQVDTLLTSYAPLASPTFTGTVTAATATLSGDLSVTGTVTANATVIYCAGEVQANGTKDTDIGRVSRSTRATGATSTSSSSTSSGATWECTTTASPGPRRRPRASRRTLIRMPFPAVPSRSRTSASTSW